MTEPFDPNALAEAFDLVESFQEIRAVNKLEFQYSVPVSLACREAELDAAGWRDHVRSGSVTPAGPYPWQEEFHRRGADHTNRAIIAANRVGKTYPCAAEVAMHLTGEYPDWWEGKVFDGPNDWCCCGVTNEELRNIVQSALFGDVVEEEGRRRPDGTGWIPKDSIVRWGFRQCGVPNVLDTVTVKHKSGGLCKVLLKSYEQGPLKFQGFAIDGLWFDEEPEDSKVWTEAMTRLVDREGIFIFSRTPLFGASDIVLTFIEDETDVTWFAQATWADAPHLTEKARLELLQMYPEHERGTRSEGKVLMGSGGVYPVSDDDLKVEAFQIPTWYRRIVGIDFGIDHPAAGVWLAHDPETDVLYVTDCYRQSGQAAAYHAEAITSRGSWIPVSWPHDGMIRDKGGGEALKDQYAARGVNMLPESARYDDYKGGGQATEPIVIEILGRMRSGRFKVFDHLGQWFHEKNLYHRKDGVIVKLRDDIMSAMHYGVMMLRYAETPVEARSGPAVTAESYEYDPLGDFSR